VTNSGANQVFRQWPLHVETVAVRFCHGLLSRWHSRQLRSYTNLLVSKNIDNSYAHTSFYVLEDFHHMILLLGHYSSISAVLGAVGQYGMSSLTSPHMWTGVLGSLPLQIRHTMPKEPVKTSQVNGEPRKSTQPTQGIPSGHGHHFVPVANIRCIHPSIHPSIHPTKPPPLSATARLLRVSGVMMTVHVLPTYSEDRTSKRREEKRREEKRREEK